MDRINRIFQDLQDKASSIKTLKRVIASAAKQSRFPHNRAITDCFVAAFLAMTGFFRDALGRLCKRPSFRRKPESRFLKDPANQQLPGYRLSPV
jgi:hypothetical protein